MFLSNFHLFDFTGKRRLLAVLGASFGVFWVAEVAILAKLVKWRPKNRRFSELANAKAPNWQIGDRQIAN